MPDSRIAYAARRAGVLAGWILSSTPPGSGSVVMASGIVSIAFHLTGWRALSVALLVVAAACWLVLTLLFVLRLVLDPARVRVESHDVGGLTSVAATGVLGTRLDLAGWPEAGIALWAVALALWVVLMPFAARGWPRATTGSHAAMSFLTGTVEDVGPFRELARWLVWVAFAVWCLTALGLVRRTRRLLAGEESHVSATVTASRSS